MPKMEQSFNPYFTGLPILILGPASPLPPEYLSFNPYFTGLPILILVTLDDYGSAPEFQSLFYWITYSYMKKKWTKNNSTTSFNPYFTGLPILIKRKENSWKNYSKVSILILLDYLFL